ncbi:MAG TPA: class I SAM-dependent methyltransferase [bacterium]|nr:class I SAM-dependent methyltransferase [bacterium]HPP87353.1 class I SAM-dependent methyltransferase [bacterium]
MFTPIKLKLTDRGYKTIKYHHPWIYQKSLIFSKNQNKKLKTGAAIELEYNNLNVGIGIYFENSLYAVKMIEFGEYAKWSEIKNIITKKINDALKYRKFLSCDNNCRLFFSEADGLPGLIIDRYENLIVAQYSNTGILILKDIINEILKSKFSEFSIIEILENGNKNWIKNEITLPICVEMDNIKFLINPLSGQKTGFYLDQRANRNFIAEYIKPQMAVLDAFAYTGAFALYALKKQANVDIIESNNKCIELFEKMRVLNNFQNCGIYQGRVDEILKSLQYLQKKYDVILLDPPALVNSANQKNKALKYIYYLFADALKLLKDSGIITVSVCSYALTDEQLKQTLLNAASVCNKKFNIIAERSASLDHPIPLHFPEANYLKFLVMKLY